MPFWIVETNRKGDVKLHPPKGQRPFVSYMRAEGYKDSHLIGSGEIVELPTTDRYRAVSMLKAKRVDQFSSVQKGMVKFRHAKAET